MQPKMKWCTTDEHLAQVAETRWRCYAQAARELPKYHENIRLDPWASIGDYLLAEQSGIAVGTATSLPLTMWIRGAPLSCQGVAYVGTIKTARRRGGVASAVMHEILRAARERGHVVSALMPFRVSFYEHFGYGLVERRADWTIPLSVLPTLDSSGWRFATPRDQAAIAEQWQSAVQAGQCDVERSAKRWERARVAEEEGMVFVDSPAPGAPIKAMALVVDERGENRRLLKVQHHWSVDSSESFLGLLSFLGTLRDQYSAVSISVPGSWQLNRLLKESQIPHRPVDHPAAEFRAYTRMQLRILDHKKYLESLRLPEEVKGRITIGIAECEGTASTFSLEIDSGHARVTDARAEPEFHCPDRHWAGIATGDMTAGEAVRMGLARQSYAGAARLLDAAFAGPQPFCREYF